MEKVKLIYQNWNDIKPILLSFSKELLTEKIKLIVLKSKLFYNKTLNNSLLILIKSK
ncbi:hypothetical protein SCLARK_00923 [Spiroplasma clarkii]|nr:hypothetical protein SCLARK_00923 [Spiroplasma clarkii]